MGTPHFYVKNVSAGSNSVQLTNAVKTCALNVQKPTCAMRPLPHLPPPLRPMLNVTLLSRVPWLSAFALWVLLILLWFPVGKTR